MHEVSRKVRMNDNILKVSVSLFPGYFKRISDDYKIVINIDEIENN